MVGDLRRGGRRPSSTPTIARNAAVAHVGGGIWARGNLYVANSTVSNNYAEGQGGGGLAAGTVGLVNSTVANNIAPVAANVGVGERLESFGSVIGPARTDPLGGQVQPTDVNCHVSAATSYGYNLVTDGSCGLSAPGDVIGVPSASGGWRTTAGSARRFAASGSAALDRIPRACRFARSVRCSRGAAPRRASSPIGWPRREGPARSRSPAGGGCDIGAVEVAG